MCQILGTAQANNSIPWWCPHIAYRYRHIVWTACSESNGTAHVQRDTYMKGGPCHEDVWRGGTWWLLILVVLAHGGRAAVIDVYADGVIDSEWMDWSFGYVEKNGAVEYRDGEEMGQEYCIGIEPYGALSFASIGGSIPINGSTLDMKIRVNDSSLADGGDLVGNMQIMMEHAENSTEPVGLRELLVRGGPESQESDKSMQRLVDGKYVHVVIDVQGLPGSEMMDSFDQITLGSCLMMDTTTDCLPVSSICASSFVISTVNSL